MQTLIEKIDLLFPPMFLREVKDGEGIVERGKKEETCTRRLSPAESKILDDIISLLDKQDIKMKICCKPECGFEDGHSPECQTKPAKLYREISELLSDVYGGRYGTKNRSQLILKLQSIKDLI
jgi:intein-encoded DNA endonuclease-like protein